MTTPIFSKLLPAGAFKVADASDIAETANAKIMTAAERQAIAQNGEDIEAEAQSREQAFSTLAAPDIIGGSYPVADIATRDAIPAGRRAAGMRITVLGDRDYVLGAGQGNDAWAPLATDAELRDADQLTDGTTKVVMRADERSKVATIVRVFPARSPYADGWIDKIGYPILATPKAGGQSVGSSAPALNIYSVFPGRTSAFSIVDRNGRYLYGGGGASLTPFVDTSGVYLDTGSADIRVAGPVGTILSPPTYSAPLLKWRDSHGGVRERRQFSTIPWTLYTGCSRLVFLPMYGQSLSVGYASGALYTTAAISPGRALMFDGGSRPLAGPTWQNGVDNARILDDAQVLTLVDLREGLTNNFGETQLSGQAFRLASAIETTSAMVFGSFGIGGAPIAALSKGTQPYANLIRSVERAKAMADVLGVAFELPFITYDQGEQDYGSAYATYSAALAQLQSDLTADINAIRGGTDQVRLVCWQPSSWTAVGYWYATAPNIAAILDLAIANPTKFAVIGPQYWSPFYASDGIHMTSHGYRVLGEYAGRAMALLRGGSTTGALYATAASYSGGTLTITFNRPLVLDTALVSNPGQNGLRLFSGSTEIALSNITVSGSTVTCSAASAPTAGYQVGIADKGTSTNNAGPTTGPRSNFRDAATDMASDGTTHLYNWACTQQIPVAIS
ncbi:hypothetical protein [Sphingomonas abietis]|uniref:Sialate O-acetylesterase domain-containing protein n=1 Tax=Sphingomonas abietis TaxID=3012344 RepID=A0ABY7NVI5_9SPHN|nr:hypothetical protein [Sphingomonas abietis]WBO23924.1 hypothetical protein PBT88_07390 [Sphingomonas abietis]